MIKQPGPALSVHDWLRRDIRKVLFASTSGVLADSPQFFAGLEEEEDAMQMESKVSR